MVLKKLPTVYHEAFKIAYRTVLKDVASNLVMMGGSANAVSGGGQKDDLRKEAENILVRLNTIVAQEPLSDDPQELVSQLAKLKAILDQLKSIPDEPVVVVAPEPAEPAEPEIQIVKKNLGDTCSKLEIKLDDIITRLNYLVNLS